MYHLSKLSALRATWWPSARQAMAPELLHATESYRLAVLYSKPESLHTLLVDYCSRLFACQA